MARFDQFDEPIDLFLVERRIMDKVREFKIFSGGKGEPRLIVGWFRFKTTAQGLLVFVRAEGVGAFAAARMILDLDIAIVRGLLA